MNGATAQAGRLIVENAGRFRRAAARFRLNGLGQIAVV